MTDLTSWPNLMSKVIVVQPYIDTQRTFLPTNIFKEFIAS